MNVERLSPSDRRLVNSAKHREKAKGGTGWILLEGARLIEDAWNAHYPFKQIWYQEAFAASHPHLMQRFKSRNAPLQPVSERDMGFISVMETPPGIAAVCPEPNYNWRKPGDAFRLIIALTGVQDPGNLGGVARTLDYFGGDELWVDENSVEPFNPKVVRGSMGAWLRLPMQRWSDMPARLGEFKAGGAELWAAAAHGGTERGLNRTTRPIILILGSESKGLAEGYKDLADRLVSLPGASRSESLNLNVAAGILIYQALVL